MLIKTGDDSNTCFSDRYNQTYHSTFGALTESSHVFLHGSGVYQRLCSGCPTRVLEIGFGLGLNCLLCADSAATNSTLLSYTGIEHTPINAATLVELNYERWLLHPNLTADLARLLTDLQFNATDSKIAAIGSHCQLHLYTEDATSSELLNMLGNDRKFDAIFLDAFSPNVNPECWTTTFFDQLKSLLAPSGRLATYCVKGSVRRNLAAAGLVAHKYPGPTGKREVLWATLATPRSAT